MHQSLYFLQSLIMSDGHGSWFAPQQETYTTVTAASSHLALPPLPSFKDTAGLRNPSGHLSYGRTPSLVGITALQPSSLRYFLLTRFWLRLFLRETQRTQKTCYGFCTSEVLSLPKEANRFLGWTCKSSKTANANQGYETTSTWGASFLVVLHLDLLIRDLISEHRANFLKPSAPWDGMIPYMSTVYKYSKT